MVNYQEPRVKLTNTQLKKLKSAAKNKIGTILRLNKKNVEDEELPHELFPTTRQTIKIKNAFANMSTDIKLSKVSKGSLLANLGSKEPANVAISLARDNLPGLVSNLTSSAINKFESKISGKGAVIAGKGFTLFILNEDMNDIIKIIKSLEDSGVLIDGVTEKVKHEIRKNKKADFLELC